MIHSSTEEGCMPIHKRFTTEPVKALLKGYCQGALDRSAVEEVLEVSKSRSLVLLREYRFPRNL